MAVDTYRQELEMGIIGHCLTQDSFSLVATILNHKNFATEFEVFKSTEEKQVITLSQVFQILESSYLNTPLSPMTMGNKVHEKHGVLLGYQLAQCVNLADRFMNIRYYAMSLLELDIRQRLIATLNYYHEQARSIENFDAATKYRHIEELVKPPMNDVFDALQEAQDFLRYMGFSECLAEVQQLNDFIPKKVAQIKRGAHINQLMHELQALVNAGPNYESREALKCLHKIAIRSIVKADITETELNQLKAISKV